MFITNNTEHVRYFFYKTLGGIPKSVKFGPLEGMEIVDLESSDQIIYNSLDFKLIGINERFGTSFLTSTKSENYLKLILTDLGTFLSNYYFDFGVDLTNLEEVNNNFSLNNPVKSIKTVNNSIIFIGGNFDFTTQDLSDTSLLKSYLNYGSATSVPIFTSFPNLVEVQTSASGSVATNTFLACPSLTAVSMSNVSTLLTSAFDSCTSLVDVYLPKLTGMSSRAFDFCSSLQSISLPKLVSISGTFNFRGCTSLQSVYLPLCTVVRNNTFENCTSLQNVYIPSCISLGSSVLNNNVFLGITGQTITLTISSSRMIANSGNPDGDIQYLQSANTLTVIQT
jgi:hypothetical protein